MKKKIIGLSILLLVLLLGLCTTSYADTFRVWQKADLQNLAYNYCINVDHMGDADAKAVVESWDSWIENTAIPILNNYDHVFIVFLQGFRQIRIQYTNDTTNLYYYSYYGDNRIGSNNPSKWQFIRAGITSPSPGSGSALDFSNSMNMNYFYFSQNVYTNTNYNTIKWNAGFSNDNIIVGPYVSGWVVPDYDFEITYMGGDITYKLLDKDGHVIQDDGVDRIYYYLGTSAFSYERLGNLINSKSTEVVTFELYAYDTKKKDYMLFKSKYGYNEHIDLSYINSVYQTTISGDFWISEIGVTSDYLIENTILEVNFYSSEDNLRYYFYCVGDNTMFSAGNITGGTISPGLTFSGDYNKDYNDNLKDDTLNDNINNINDTLTDNSQVDGMLAEFTSGDFASNIGFVEHENPFQTFILQFVYEVCDVLLASGDVYFDYSMHGETPHRIYASSFTTPETPLKAFIRLAMIFGALFVLYNQFRHVVELINTGNAAQVLHQEDADMYFYKM